MYFVVKYYLLDLILRSLTLLFLHLRVPFFYHLPYLSSPWSFAHFQIFLPVLRFEENLRRVNFKLLRYYTFSADVLVKAYD
jgi:hypothetical protein